MAPSQCYGIDSKPLKTSHPDFLSSGTERWKLWMMLKTECLCTTPHPHPNPYVEVLAYIVMGFGDEAFGR